VARRGNKYGARKTTVDGYRFDSKLESQRYLELRARRDEGIITNLARQVSFKIFWPGHGEDKKWLLFTYVADFAYNDAEGNYVVEDVKGNVTGAPMGVFRIKKKAVLFDHGIIVHIVTRKRMTWSFDNVPELTRYYTPS
jgi:hypothetical protein